MAAADSPPDAESRASAGHDYDDDVESTAADSRTASSATLLAPGRDQGSSSPTETAAEMMDETDHVSLLSGSGSRAPSPAPSAKPKASTGWLQLPHKTQLLVLALCRLSEPLNATSLLSYLYYFIGSLHGPDEEPPSAPTIARRAGLMASSFALAQCLTGFMWGRLSDRIGRKPVIMLGLLGSTLSILCFGFSENYATAMFFRILGGCLNGNVGVLRTMVSEVVREKRHQSRAFLIMPMCFNIGIIIGPMLGGLLADPASHWPDTFGDVYWMRRWPYALPNITSAFLLSMSWIAGFLFLKETHPYYQHRTDPGRQLCAFIAHNLRRLSSSFRYSAVPTDDIEDGDEEDAPPPKPPGPRVQAPTKPLRAILTRNIVTTLFAFTILPLHNATFMHLYGIFLSTPRSDAGRHGLRWSGGLGLPPDQVGYAMTLLGFIGISLQLFLYPPLQAYFGLLRSYRAACCFFPLAYLATPLLVLFPSTSAPPDPAAGPLVWLGLCAVLGLQVTARTFALPGAVILLTNSVEDATVLGTVHGLGTSLASAARAVGPITGATLYALGLEHGVVGIVFWCMTGIACISASWSMILREGKGIAGK